jgi:hypothetical protein
MGKNLYRLYIDESGDHNYYDYKKPEHNIAGKRYLSLLGMAISQSERERASAEFDSLKKKHFSFDPDDPIILHRSAIINKKGPFYVLQEATKEREFNEDLMQFMNTLHCVLILVIIDKKRHIEKCGKLAFHPYHFSLTALLERYCGYLNFWNYRGDVLAEKRGGKEDRALAHEYRCRYEQGTYYYDAPFFQRALTTAELKLKDKRSNIMGLQVADLLAHPCKQQFLRELNKIEEQPDEFGVKLYDSIKYKFNTQIYKGTVKGYGKVFIG